MDRRTFLYHAALGTAPSYLVLFEEHTERPASRPLTADHRAGTFVCATCFLPPFAST